MIRSFLRVVLLLGALGSSPARAASGEFVPERSSATHATALQAAWDAERHAVEVFLGEGTARNPGHGWTTRFDGRGFLVTPDAGGWAWGLELTRYGRPGRERSVPPRASARFDGQRVHYDWDAVLTEWYINDRPGLEHGYTVHSRPSDGAGDLVLVLAVRGDLVAVPSRTQRDVRFADASGSVMLDYSGLVAFDSVGRVLPARFEHVEAGLALVVDDRDARYPVTIDPIASRAYLKASNTQADDRFGGAISVSGDTIAIGAYGEDGSATGVGGNQNDNAAATSGAVYVFVRSGSSWTQQAYIKPSNTGAGDLFGYSVSLSGDTLVVGARGEDSSSAGVNGNPFDEGAQGSGAAYVFVRTGTTWSQQAYLKASNPEAFDAFGHAVALSGDVAVVTAVWEDGGSTGVGGNQASNTALDSGAAYIFTRSGTTWTQTAYVKPSNTDAGDWFGVAAAASGDTIALGARYEASNATGVGGDQTNDLTLDAGAVYVFRRAGAVWSQESYIKASNTGQDDEFGTALSLEGNTLVAGAWGESSAATGVNGNQLDNGAVLSGAAYVFTRSGSTWSQEAYLKASNTGAGDSFGLAVSMSGNTLLVGSIRDDSQASGVNGNPHDNSASNAGSAFVFVRNGATWSQDAYLKATNPDIDDRFGWSVAVSGDLLVVGTYEEDSSATGVNGNQADDSAVDSGAAYVFVRDHAPVVFCTGDGLDASVTTPCGALGSSGPCLNAGALGNGCANSVNAAGARLAASGAPVPDSIALAGSGMPATVACIYLQGDAVDDQPFGDGVRCAGGTLIRLQTKANVGGASQFPAVGDPSVSTRGLVVPGSGATRYYQTYYRNSAPAFCPPQTFNVTNGIALSW